MPMDLEFTKPVEVDGRWVQWAHPTDAFWTQWRNSKYELGKAGVYIEQKIDPDTGGRTWLVKRILQKRANMEILDGVPITPIPVRDPSKLLHYQAPIVSQLMAALVSYRVALDCSETGTGKTYHALGAAKELGMRPGIICTKTAIPDWRRVCEKHFGINPLFVINWESAKTSKFYYVSKKPDPYRQGFIFEWKIPASAKPLLIFDEIHRANGDYTQNQALLLGAAGRYPCLGLSATVTDKIAKFRGVGAMLGLFKQDDFDLWLKNQGLFKDKFHKWQSLEDTKDMQRLNKVIFPRYGARVRKMDIPGFPKVQNIAKLYPVKNTKTLNYEFDKLQKQIAELKAKKRQGDILALQTRYRQLAELNKVDLLAELAQELIENGHHVPIFVNFKETMKALQDKLRCSCVVHGGQTGKKGEDERRRAIDDFQADKEPIIILNIKAGGVSISLHDLHGLFPRSQLICPTYNAIDLVQVLGRPHRAGAKSLATNYLIYAKDTIEEKIFSSVLKKIKNIETFNDGDLDVGGVF